MVGLVGEFLVACVFVLVSLVVWLALCGWVGLVGFGGWVGGWVVVVGQRLRFNVVVGCPL